MLGLNKQKLISCLIISLWFSFSCASASELFVDDLPASGESLSVAEDTLIWINETEIVNINGLNIIGDEQKIVTVRFHIDGEFLITGNIFCENVDLEILTTKNGLFSANKVDVITDNNNNFSINNSGSMFLNNFSRETYRGFTYIFNYGELLTENLFLKDQNDGTIFLNNGNANLNSTTLVANGAVSLFEITNKGNLNFFDTSWDVNYGGLIVLNSVNGTLSLTNAAFDISGSSHGKSSTITIVDGNSSWRNCTIQNSNAQFSYVNEKIVEIYNMKISTINGGNTQIINNGNLKAEQFLVETKGEQSNISITNEDTFTFNPSIISGISLEKLSSIDESGEVFPQPNGGTISFINKGSVNHKDTSISGNETNLESIFYFVIIVVIILLLTLGYVYKKNKKL